MAAIDDAPGHRADRAPWRYRASDPPRWLGRDNLLGYLLLLALSVVVVVLTSSTMTKISVFDEATHIDYALRAAHWELPRAGETMSQQTLAEWACRGSRHPAIELPACGSAPFRPQDFPVAGLQYNYGHPPLYYLITGTVTRAVVAVTDLGFVTVARSLGALWLAAGLVVLFQVLQRAGLPRTYALAATAGLAVTPSVAEFSSIVSNDAAAVLCGSLVALVTVEVVLGRARWPLVAVTAIAITLTKVIFVVALIGAGLAWLIVAGLRRDHGAWRLRALTLVMAACAVVTDLAWTWFQSGRGMAGYRSPVLGINSEPAASFPFGPTIGQLFATWPPTPETLSQALDSPALAFWQAVVTLLLAAGPLVVLLSGRPRWAAPFALGTAAALLLVPVAVQGVAFVTEGHYFPVISTRYGLVCLPALLAMLAFGCRIRHRTQAAITTAAVGFLCLTSSLLLYG